MMLLVGRGLPGQLATVRSDPSWSTVGADELALQIDEVAGMLQSQGISDENMAASVQALSSGWPVAVAAFCSRLRSDPTAATTEMARPDMLIDRLMHGYLDGIAEADLVASRTLAILPFFDDRVAELVGSPGLVERLAVAGIPLTRQADGWTELPEQFRASLIRSPAATGATTIDPKITDYFVRRGEIHAAINACLAVGDSLGAAKIVGDASYTQEAQFEPSALNASMTTVGNVAEQVPRSLLVQASVNVAHGAVVEGLACIERAAAVAGLADPALADSVHQEILLELGVWRHFTGNAAESRQLMARVRSVLDVSPGTDANRARLLDLQGLLSTTEGTKAGLETARVHMTEALAIWRQLSEPRAAALTTIRLVSEVLVDLGRRQEAIVLLDSLPAVGPMTLADQARINLYRSELLPFLGRANEVPKTLDEVRRIAAILGQDRLLGMAACSEAIAASFGEDPERVHVLVDEFEAQASQFGLDSDVSRAWCLLASALTRCESYERAEMALAKAKRNEGLHESAYEFARISLLAHTGDPAIAASLLDELTVREDVIPERRWSIALHQALCAWRAGEHDRADKHLRASFDEAADLHHDALPLIAERRVVEQIRGGEVKLSLIHI